MGRRRLKDGTEVELRPLEPDDAELLLEGFGALSAQSRYERFFTAVPRLPGHWLEELLDVDHRDREAIAALLAQDEAPLGLARYVRCEDDPGEAEFAVTVADAWQGRGVGRLLMGELIDAARANGLRRLTGDVHATNVPMLRLAESLGRSATLGPPQEGIVHAVIEL